jgi:hypothetical protein
MQKTILLLLFFLLACKSDPTEFLEDPRNDGATGEWSGEWLIYGDRLETGGGIILQPGGENQYLNDKFQDPAVPERNNVIRYSWNGQQVAGQYIWSALSLSVAANSETYTITPPLDLSYGGYRKLTFWAKVSLSDSTIVEFRGPIPDFRIQQTENSEWKKFVVYFQPHMLRNVRDFFVVTFRYVGNPVNAHGNGGTVCVDEVRYEN